MSAYKSDAQMKYFKLLESKKKTVQHYYEGGKVALDEEKHHMPKIPGLNVELARELRNKRRFKQ